MDGREHPAGGQAKTGLSRGLARATFPAQAHVAAWAQLSFHHARTHTHTPETWDAGPSHDCLHTPTANWCKIHEQPRTERRVLRSRATQTSIILVSSYTPSVLKHAIHVNQEPVVKKTPTNRLMIATIGDRKSIYESRGVESIYYDFILLLQLVSNPK